MADQITQVLGIVAMSNKGEYNSQTNYEKLNVVSYNGSSYCAKQNCTGILPTDPNYWQLLASKGEQGNVGPQGVSPVRGVDYYNESDKAAISSEIETDVINEVREQLGSLTSISPKAVSSISDMTDTASIYVLTSDGHWYWYNGSAWTDGGVYQTYVTDDYVSSSSSLINQTYKIKNNNQYPVFQLGSFLASTGEFTSNTNRCRTGRIEPYKRGLVYKIKEAGWKLRVAYYSSATGTPEDFYIKYVNWTKDFCNALYEPNSYILLCLSKDDDSTITTEELESVNAGNILEITYLTDKELKNINSPADAKVVGSNISNLFRSSTENKILDKALYPNSEIKRSNGANQGNVSNRTRTGRLSLAEIGNFIKLTDIDYKMQVYYYNSNVGNWGDTYAGESFDWCNELLLDTSYPYFALNFKKNNNDDIDETDRETIKSSLIAYTLTDKTLTEANVPADAKAVGNLLDISSKSIKILGIGNSYTRDCLRWVSKILLEANYNNVIVGHGYIGGITLQQQYASLDDNDPNHSAYEYFKYNNSAQSTNTLNQTLDSILADEDWDVVIFQQQSDDAGQYNTFVNSTFDINDFITYVKNHINNENIKIGINATWSHNAEYSSSKFIDYYGRNPVLQYNAIQSNIPNVANHMSQCDFVINTGLAINIARNHPYIKDVGNNLLRTDNNHLAFGIPEFMCAYCYIKAITKVSASDFNWYPTNVDNPNITQTGSYLAYLAKQIAEYSNSFSQIYNDIGR